MLLSKPCLNKTGWIFITICNYYKRMVEAAGVEPASENNLPWLLHTYLKI